MIKYNFKCIYYHFLTENLLSFSVSFSLYLIGSFFLVVFGLKISQISSIWKYEIVLELSNNFKNKYYLISLS